MLASFPYFVARPEGRPVVPLELASIQRGSQSSRGTGPLGPSL